MEGRKPIPIPARLRWREFRCRQLPPIIFTVTLLGVVGLWLATVEPPAIVGQAIARKADVIAPAAGSLLSLNVVQYQSVEKGDILARIQPDGMRVQLDTFRLRMDFLRNQSEPMTEKKRNAVNYYRLRLEWFEQRVALAAAKVNLQRAENELSRDRRLFDEKLISADQFDLSQKNVQALAAETAETAKLVSELGAALEGLQDLDAAESEDIAAPLQAAMQAQERHLKRIEQLSEPTILQAPIAGKIAKIHRLPGENILRGDRVLAITAETPAQILAYLKTPVSVSIEPGAPVKLQTRGLVRKEAAAFIESIGPEWQTLTPGSEFAGLRTAPERGLPILVNLPPELEVRPGELVNVFLAPQ